MRQLPENGETTASSDVSTIQCGQDAAKHFAFDPGYTNLNHGSYGTYPIEVRSALQYLRERTEARPDTFIRYDYRTKLLDDSRKVIAQYVHAPVDTCVYVPNATTGVETVLRNLQYEPGDVAVCFATVYEAFANTLRYLQDTTPLRMEVIDVEFPTSHASICQLLEQTIQAIESRGQVPCLVLFETITTTPGIRMPFEKLIEICRTHKVLSLVDAAHGIGQIPFNLSELNPDFLATNCHKWLHVPRPCALFYVPERNQHLLKTTLPTSFRMRDEFVNNFAYVGTLDDTPYLCIDAALRWRSRLTWNEKRGEEAAMGYTLDLARKGGRAVAGVLGTNILDNEEGELGACNFAMVRLPLSVAELAGNEEVTNAGKKISAWVMRTMTLEYGTAIVATFYRGACWAQLSAQVYLTLEDFADAGAKLQEVCARAQQVDWRSGERTS